MSAIIQGINVAQNGTPRADMFILEDGTRVPPHWLRDWPDQSFLLPGDWGNPIMQYFDAPQEFAWDPVTPGTATKRLIAGYTRNAAGTPVAGVTVKVFRTVDDVIEQTLVSDVNGHFEAYVSTSGTYYLVGELAGSPDTSGATDNNLSGV